MDEILVNQGGSVKAAGDGRVQGYLIQFSDADNPDLSAMKDFFRPTTDYDFEDGDKRSIYFHHGLDSTLKTRKLGRVEMKTDEVGVWVDGILNMRDDYERAVYQLAAKGKLGWSSGAPAHLVQRQKVEGKNAHEVLHWVISEASMTPNPADPRNEVVAIKTADMSVSLFANLLREMEGKPPIETKSVLGDMTPDIVAAAFDRLSSKLSRFVYQQLWGDSWGCCRPAMSDDADANDPIDREMIVQALDEYSSTLLAVLDALLALPKADATATKSFLAQFDRTGSKDVVTLLSAMPIKTYLETMGAVVSDSDRRLAWYAEQREIKQGRAISSENLASMQDIHDGMKSHLERLRAIIDKHSPKSANLGAREFARYLAIGASGAGATISF